MKQVVIFGNSGSGKSTLAKELAASEGLAPLDLDGLAWKPTSPPERVPLEEAGSRIHDFIRSADSWVIEGCYSDLLEQALPFANEIIFLDLPIEACIANARQRPWEPHKYESKEAQDANLDMLIDWIRQYEQRADAFSRQAHQSFYEAFAGQKTRFTANERG